MDPQKTGRRCKGVKNNIKSVVVLTVICVVVSLLLALTNSVTAPIIAANRAASENASLIVVLPGAAGFEELEKPGDCPESVQKIYRDTGGSGYVATVSVTSQYSKSDMCFTVGVHADGTISDILITSYGETKDFGTETYPKTYVGKDSALTGVELYSGATYSSAAFKNGVSDVFTSLISLGLIGEGVKTDEQKAAELLDTVLPGAASDTGKGSLTETECSLPGATAYKATNGAGYAVILDIDGSLYVCAVDAFGSVKVLDTDGSDVTEGSGLADTLKDEFGVLADAASENDISRLSRYVPEGAVITPLHPEGLFSTVTGAYLIESEGDTLYGFVAHPVGYNSGTMTVWYVLDGSGAIVTFRVSEFILNADYYDDYVLDKDAYVGNIEGKTADTLTDGDTVISGATITSNALGRASRDVFAAFDAVSGNGGAE